MDVYDVAYPGVRILKVEHSPCKRTRQHEIKSTRQFEGRSVFADFCRPVAAQRVMRQSPNAVVPFCQQLFPERDVVRLVRDFITADHELQVR